MLYNRMMAKRKVHYDSEFSNYSGIKLALNLGSKKRREELLIIASNAGLTGEASDYGDCQLSDACIKIDNLLKNESTFKKVKSELSLLCLKIMVLMMANIKLKPLERLRYSEMVNFDTATTRIKDMLKLETERSIVIKEVMIEYNKEYPAIYPMIEYIIRLNIKNGKEFSIE
jgi:hypothetical protein